MKKNIFGLFFLVISISLAQQRQFDIKWQETKVLETDYSRIEIPFFDERHFSFDDNNGIKYFNQWESSEQVDEDSSQITNIVYETITKGDLKQLDESLIPTDHQLYLRNAVARNQQFVYLELSPIINDSGVYKRIKSFSITYNTTAQNRNFQSSRNTNQLMNSVLRTGNWYKFYVTESGVYRLNKSFLNALGLNTNGLDPRTIKIYGNGGRMLPLLNSEEYPIDLTENAIKFVGEEDGSFDNGDFILFMLKVSMVTVLIAIPIIIFIQINPIIM